MGRRRAFVFFRLLRRGAAARNKADTWHIVLRLAVVSFLHSVAFFLRLRGESSGARAGCLARWRLALAAFAHWLIVCQYGYVLGASWAWCQFLEVIENGN